MFNLRKLWLRERLVRTAKSYVGRVRYQLKSQHTHRLVLDCSSFTRLVCQTNGITLPRGAKAQSKVGLPIYRTMYLRKGDLILFSGLSSRTIDHVGLYIGHGQFIHNMPRKGVVITPLSNWKNRFLMGRHILK